MNLKVSIIIGSILIIFIGVYFFLYQNNFEANKIPNEKMSFFITSVNPGRGANLGGLDGADSYCKNLAEDVGIKGKEWAAYLSAKFDDKIVNAKDRIGQGPWYNFNGEMIATDLDNLHKDNNLNKNTALTEKGEIVFGRGDTPNMHDILTGSTMQGLYYATTTDSTCNNWTSDDEGSAIVGHHDRIGINDSPEIKSWVASHLTKGCNIAKLKSTGGGGLFYCFAK